MPRPARAWLFWLALLPAACVPREPPEPPPPPPLPTPQILFEEEVKPIERALLAILDIREEGGQEGQPVTVTGTIINRGNGPARQLTVTVTALDAAGASLLSVTAQTSSTTLEPRSTARFVATFLRPSGTDQYHVDAVGGR